MSSRQHWAIFLIICKKGLCIYKKTIILKPTGTNDFILNSFQNNSV